MRAARCAAVLLAACVGAFSAVAEDAAPLVLTGTQATYSLTVALAAGTPVRVENVPADGRQLGALKDYIERRADALAPKFAEAAAVVTLTNALPGDPLYRFAREANIRVVDVEAAVPWSVDEPGVALADAPVSNVAWADDTDPPAGAVAPYLWLSVSNAIRMGDIVAADLMALFPDSAATIEANLEALKRSLLGLRGEYQQRLIESGADVVFALTGDFVYLTNDMGLYVDGYFIKQDVRWTEADLANLTRHLRDNAVEIVLHKWEPSEAIQAAIRAAGAELVVLDTGDSGVVVDRALARDGLQQILRKNLAAIVAAAVE
jgi:ABC-type Zn uptake system ZnuABC Zn-binding protein ZnuA